VDNSLSETSARKPVSEAKGQSGVKRDFLFMHDGEDWYLREPEPESG
jgi:hypothetical protein